MSLKYLALGVALASVLNTSPVDADEFKSHYQGVEAAVTDQADLRTRIENDFSLVGKYRLRCHFMHQFDVGDPDSFFGKNRIMFGGKNSDTLAALILKLDQDGVFDTKLGFRNYSVAKDLSADYGWLEGGINSDSSFLTLFLGYKLPKGDFWFTQIFDHSNDTSTYTELQVMRTVGKNNIFYRLEMTEFKNPVHLLGFTLK